MIGLGQIVTIGNSSNRIHEMRLFEEVSKVDDKEAEEGAIHSDFLRLTAKDRGDQEVYSKKGLAQRISGLWRTLKSDRRRAEEQDEEQCEVAKARAQSLVGENAPMGWLTYDQMGDSGGSGAFGLESVQSSSKGKAASKETVDLSFLQSDPDDSEYMFNEEWFLCGSWGQFD